MEIEEIINRANNALAQEFEVELSVFESGVDIKETLELDSLALVDMVALLETEFGIQIKGTEIVSVKTFQNLYDFLANKING